MDVAARFAAIIEALCRAVAARGAGGAFGIANGAIVILLWSRLRRAASGFTRLAQSPPRPRRLRRPPNRHVVSTSRRTAPTPVLPRRHGWLLAPVPEARAAASQLRVLLDDPEAIALIGADPRFGRILRPLCRSLGIALPTALRRPARKSPTPPRHRPRPAPAPRWSAH